MNANAKLLKKKRIARIGSKPPNMGFEESNLPPDDFVSNIIKDMESKKDVYQQLQDSRSQKRQEQSINKDDFNSIYNRKEKKFLPKKTFPLMQKCQTSLKHLKKNRCIPKPRAHVGVVTKPQQKPLNTQQSFTAMGYRSCSKIIKPCENSKNSTKLSKSSAISQTNSEVHKDIKSRSTETDNLAAETSPVDDYLSSSDDNAFENFVQNNRCDSSDSSSDSDSRIIIRRKRSKTKSKQKKKIPKENLFSHDELKKHLPKVTSMPLSDSSESESEETLEVKKKNPLMKYAHSEQKTDYPIAFQKTSSKSNNSEKQSFSDLSEDSLMDTGALNYDSSNSESNLEAATPNQLLRDQVSNITDNIDLTNNFKSYSNSVPTKYVPKYSMSCYVRLKRDPVLDKKAMIFCSTIPVCPTLNVADTFDENDCIIISDNDEPEVPNSKLNILSSSPVEDTEPEDCVLMCEMPKSDQLTGSVNLTSNNSASLLNTETQMDNLNVTMSSSNLKCFGGQAAALTSVEDSCNQQSLHTKTDIDECVKLCEEKTKSDVEDVTEFTSELCHSDITCNEFNSKKSLCIKQEDDTAQDVSSEFNVKIVEVHSLIERNEPPTELNAVKNNVEVIDISDDNLTMPVIKVEQSNAVKEGLEQPIYSKIHNQSESYVNPESKLSSCEPDPKILEILSKINFDCIKEVLNNTSSESSACFNKDYAPILACGTDAIAKEMDSESYNTILEKNGTGQSKNTVKHPGTTNMLVTEISSACDKEAILLNNDKKLLNDNFKDCLSLKNRNLTTSNQESSNLPNQRKSFEKDEHSGTNITFNDSIACTSSNQLEFQINSTKSVPIDLYPPKIPKETVSDETEIQIVHECNVVRKEQSVKNLHITKPVKNEVIESPSDELDVIAASYIKDLNSPDKRVLTLLDLYKTEYDKYKQIKNTEMNVSAGLKMLHANQVKKLMNLHSSIKNLVKHDTCFYEVNSDSHANVKSEVTKGCKVQNPENSKDMKREDLDVGNKALNLDAAGPSKEKILKYMMNFKCAQCGKPATARCQGCSVVYYCSPQCGVQSWKQGHFAVCKRM